jgi:ABC-type transporter MlaC component
MPMSDDLVSEDDLARARQDPAFRQQLMTKNLDKLLAALTKARQDRSKDPEVARQMREGVDLAVLLADRIQREDDGSGSQVA